MTNVAFRRKWLWIGPAGAVMFFFLMNLIFTGADLETVWSLPASENGNYYAIQISPDGKSLAGVKNNKLELFDLKLKQLNWQIDKHFLPTLAWLNDGHVIAVPFEHGRDLTVYSKDTGAKLRKTIFGSGCEDLCCCGEIIAGITGDTLRDFSGPGQPFVLRRDDLRGFVPEDTAGEFSFALNCEHSSGLSVTACQIEATEYRLAVTHRMNCPVKIFSLTMNEDSYIEGRDPPSIIVQLIQEVAVSDYSRTALSGDGSFLIILSQQGVVKYDWKEKRYQQVAQLKIPVDVNESGKCLAISSDSQFIACCTGTEVVVLRSSNLKVHGRINSPSYAICFTPDSRQLAVAHHRRVDAFRLNH